MNREVSDHILVTNQTDYNQLSDSDLTIIRLRKIRKKTGVDIMAKRFVIKSMLLVTLFSVEIRSQGIPVTSQSNPWNLNMLTHMVSGQPSSYFPVPAIRDPLLPVSAPDIVDDTGLVLDTFEEQRHLREKLMLWQSELWYDEENARELELEEALEQPLSHAAMLLRQEADVNAVLIASNRHVRDTDASLCPQWQECYDPEEMTEQFLEQFVMLSILLSLLFSGQPEPDADIERYDPSDPSTLPLPQCENLLLAAEGTILTKLSQFCSGATSEAQETCYLCVKTSWGQNYSNKFVSVFYCPRDASEHMNLKSHTLCVQAIGAAPDKFPPKLLVTIDANASAQYLSYLDGILKSREMYLFNKVTQEILFYKQRSHSDGEFIYEWAEETTFEGQTNSVTGQLADIKQVVQTLIHRLAQRDEKIEALERSREEEKEQRQQLEQKLEKISKSHGRLVSDVQSELGNLYTNVNTIMQREQTAIANPAKQISSSDLITRFESNIRSLQNSFDVLARQIDALNVKVEENTETVGTLQTAMDQCTKAITHVNGMVNEVGLKVDILAVRSTNGILIWKVNEVEKRIEEAKTGKILSLYSPPFFTSLHGYRMCLRLYMDGDGQAKGNHLSIFLVIMKSDYDDLLNWPFKQKVTLFCINQQDPYNTKAHIAQAFRPTETSTSFQKPRGPFNTASGFPKFMPVEKLRDRNFVQDDCMYFKVKIDMTNINALDNPAH